MNNIALKNAWDSKWKKDSKGILAPSVIIITPNCLRVERAIIFFMSISNIAVNPAIIIVNVPININPVERTEVETNIFIRISKYTPAVTRVDEWTKAETGVGAAIAAGNHAEKGIWALLVQADVITININNSEALLSILLINLYVQSPSLTIILIQINNPTSPSRLVSAVIIPALKDLDLW